MGHTPGTNYGDDCTSCFIAGNTPKYVTAYFLGVEDCEPLVWPEKGQIPTSMLLTQDAGVPCRWWGGDLNGWHATYYASVGGDSTLGLMFRNTNYFGSICDSICETHFDNQINCNWMFNYGHSGSGHVFLYPDPQVTVLLTTMNFLDHPDTKYEAWLLDADTKVFLLANVRMAMNVRVKIDE